MKKQLLLFVIFFLSVSAESQTKHVIGDTTLWYRYTEPLLNTIEATDFINSQDDFNFRFRNLGQVVEIRRNKGSIQGTLVNYIFKGGKKRQTIFSKTIINDSIAIKTNDLISKSGILELNSDENIEGWKQGADGITYFIEHTDKDNYWYKTYWTPTSQDSLREVLIINNFVNNLSELLELPKSYEAFKQTLPHNGCYSSGGLAMTCYTSSSYALGYSGSVKLPFGYTAYADIGYITDKQVNFGVLINHQFDTNGYYDFSGTFVKGSLLFRNETGLTDYFFYNYRQRKYEDIKEGTRFINHKVLYGLNLKIISLGLGADFLNGEKSKVGGLMFFQKYISKPKLTISSKASVFKDQFDYLFEASKFFELRSISPIRGMDVGMYYENFAKHGNLGFSCKIILY